MNESCVRIVVKKETFEQEKSSPMFGVIFFEVNGFCFPDHNWGDFPVVVASWWAKSIIELNFNKSKPIELDFMDGPYKISISLISDDLCKIKFIEEKSNGKEFVLKEITTSFQLLLKEITILCKKIVSFIKNKKIELVDDYKNLEQSYQLLLKI